MELIYIKYNVTLLLIMIEYYNGTKKCPILMADSTTGQIIQGVKCHTGTLL